MPFEKLPRVREDRNLDLPHFPSRFHAAVFRFWETVGAGQIASALGTTADTVTKAAEDMGLPLQQKFLEDWSERGYITTIRNAWHILPYEQILALLGWDEERLADVLKEDDFLNVKLGGFKPFCDPVHPQELDTEQTARLLAIKQTVSEHCASLFSGAEPFHFFNEELPTPPSAAQDDGLRLVYSYCGLYASVLEKDIAISYPDELLKMYQTNGVNAVWLPVLLYQMVPFPFDGKYSLGYEKRQARLRTLVERAAQYGIKVYLYLNEPRCMPLAFFDEHPELLGAKTGMYGALCTSEPRVMQYLRYAVRTLCEAVPGLGGFFTITCSENLTHCKSNRIKEHCERCKDAPIYRLVADVITAISEESRRVDPEIKTIAWTWAWDDFMTHDEIKKCIDLIPEEVVIQCNSEAQKPFMIGGVSGTVQDYSMSVIGPAPLAKSIWDYARNKGHEVCAKVQVNVTWECSPLPFLPVFDLIREHMSGLREMGVEHLMLSWTLGGYPSVNFKVASQCLSDPSDEKYLAFLREEYGENAHAIERAAKIFSEAFREFPFNIQCIYKGPQNAGPSNLLYMEPTGFKATMTCYAYDDIETWRAIYPQDIYIDQLRKMSERWREGLSVIEQLGDCQFRLAALGGYALFRSSYLQADFVANRESGNMARLLEIVREEEELALLMYDLMSKDATFGFEASNHYYFNKGMLAEKVINCRYIAELVKMQ